MINAPAAAASDHGHNDDDDGGGNDGQDASTRVHHLSLPKRVIS